MAPLAARPTPHRAEPLAAGGLRKDQGTVRDRAQNPRLAKDFPPVVCATDAGREGELIFRYIYEAAQCAKPVSRLWISSLTPEAIRKGFDSLTSGAPNTMR